MASGRQSVSPTTDEVYQSPGASQDDSIDQMLAQYSGLVERRQGESTDGGDQKVVMKKESGNENGRGSVTGAMNPPVSLAGGTVQPHSTNLAIIPSPRHALSAPPSRRSTPARDDDHTTVPDGSAATGGLSSDIRSFSWDNVATGARAQASDVNYPTTAAEIIELLHKNICFLSGGRAKEGQSLITFPAKDKNFEYNRDELRRVIQYLASIPMEDVREYGFSVIVDSRHSNWHSTKQILHSLQEVLPGQVHVAYIVQPSHFWQKQATTRGHNKEKKKNRLEFSTIMLSDVDKLKRHIDPSQVTSDLGGYLPYNHDDWIKLRWDLEKCIASFNALMEHTSHVEQQLHIEQEGGGGGDVETAEDALTRHIQIHDQLRKAPQSTIREGNELLRRLEQGRDEGGTSAMTPDKINAVSVIRRLLENVNRRQTQMDDMWREKRGHLEQTLELRVFEKALQKVRGWLKARGEETLNSRSDIGDSVETAQTIKDQHNKFDTKAKTMYNNLTQLRRMADQFVGKNHFAADTLQHQVAKLSNKFSRFESHLAERRRIVVGSLRLHTSYREWNTQSEHTSSLLKEEVSPPDQTSAEQLLSEHEEVVAQLEELGSTVEKEGHDLLEVMEIVTRRSLETRNSGQSPSRPGPDYSVGIEYVETILDNMKKKRHRIVQLAEARRLNLQQCKQLHNCESDAKQVTKWLIDISEKLSSSHGDIGTSKQAIEKLLNEHDKLAENAKKTYKYGCDLLSAAQRSRKASHLEEANNSGLLGDLAKLWEGLSAALVEARARLEIAQQFHFLADEVMECYSRWTMPIHQLPKTPPTVEARLRDISDNKEGFTHKISECLKIGASLLDRMCRPLTTDPTYRNLNEATKQSLAFLRSRQQEIERQTIGLQSVLARQESVLKQFLVYCQFENDMEQVLVWMQDQGLKSMQRFSVIGETHSTIQSQLSLFDTFNTACKERGEQVERLVTTAPRQEAEITGFKSELTKKTTSLSAVWQKFSSRLKEREKALKLAATFYDQVTKLQSLTGELEAHLSPEVLTIHSPLKLYLDNLTEKHTSMASLFNNVSEGGAALTELFKPTNDMAGDSGRAGRISAQISNLKTHCNRVDQLWKNACERVRENHQSVTSQATRDTGVTNTQSTTKKEQRTSKTGKTSSNRASKTGQTSSTKTSTTKSSETSSGTGGKKEKTGKTTPLTSQPTKQPSSPKTYNVGGLSKRRGSGKRKHSEIYGDLEAESYKHLERLESECAKFHSTHCEMHDDMESVSDLKEQYLKFLDIITPTCSSIDDVISSLQALKMDLSPPPSPTISVGVDQVCEGLRKRVEWWRGGFKTVANTIALYLSFSQLSSKVDSDLQTLEDSFCETIDVNVTMEIAQSMLDRYQPLVEELKKSYPTMKDLGERFLESTTKMASERMTPQLKVGGPCISVAMTMGGVEGRYPEAMEVWSQREKQLRQSLEWQSFRQTTEQLSSWIKEASESFLVRFDLGTSLVTTEDLEMEFQEFKARAQVTTREVETALVQSDHMLADNHYATTSLRELAWNMRELLEDFTARIEERERTLHEAADFFRAAEKLQDDMKDVIIQCKESLSTVQLKKETSLTSVSSRLVNLQTAGANLVSLGEGRKKGSVRGRKRKLIRSDSSGATEFSLKQTLSNLQLLYTKYKAALEGRRVGSIISKRTEKKEEVWKDRLEVKEISSVVLRRKDHTKPQSKNRESEIKRSSLPVGKTALGTQVSDQWKSRSVDRRSTIAVRSAARQAVKAEKLQDPADNQESIFKRSHTLPGHFRGRRAPGLSVLEKAAAFSQVTEGTGLAAPFGLHTASRRRRPSLEGRDLETKKFELRQKTAAEEEKTLAASAKTVAKKEQFSNTAVKTAVVKTVIAKQEPAKRVSLVNIDSVKKPTTVDAASLSPSVSPIPITRVVSPSSVVLPSEQEPPPRVVSPDPNQVRNRSNRSKSPVTTTLSSLSTTSKNTRRSIQNLKIAGKVSHLKHVFDRQEEESVTATGEPVLGKKSPSTSPRRKGIERHLSPDIVPKEPTVMTSEVDCVLTQPLKAAENSFSSPDIMLKKTSETGKTSTVEDIVSNTDNERGKDAVVSLAPLCPESPQNYSPSPELQHPPPPPRPPSPIGHILEEASDGESSYQSYDTEYSDDDDSELDDEEIDGELEEVDSATISKRTIKTLHAVTLDLISYELSYIRSLEILAESYLPSLLKSHVPSFLQGRGRKIFANITDLYEVHRNFYAELNVQKLDSGPAIVESFCQTLVRNKDSWNQYQTYLLNMEQGQRILSQYGGTFFQEVQSSIGDRHTLEEHFVKPREQLVRYDRILRDVVMCAQKEYLHGVGVAKDALRVIQNILHTTNNSMVMAKLRGCPISLDKTSLLMAEQFNMYTTEKKKVVREMVVLLHQQYIIFAVDLMGGKEYDYWEHIETTDLHLMETYKTKEDRFALSPGPPTSAHYLYVVQPLSDDPGVKNAWITMLRSLIRQGARDSIPLHDTVLPLPYHFRQTDIQGESVGEGEVNKTGSLKRRGSLKRSLSLSRKKNTVKEGGEQGKSAAVKRTDSFDSKKELVLRRTGSLKRNKRGVNEAPPPEIQLKRKPEPTNTADDSYLYVAVEDFTTEVEGFLTVKKGQLVEVLDQGANNWLVVTLASAPGELEDEGFLPVRCLQPASKMGISRPTSTNTASSQPLHTSHDQMRMSGDQSMGSHDAISSVTTPSKRSGHSQQFISQVVEDIYYSCEDTSLSSPNDGLLSMTYGQAVEVLDISDGDLWLVKTVDPTNGKPVEGMVRRSWLVSKPPPPYPPKVVGPVQNGLEPDQERNGIGGHGDKVQLRGHPPPTSSAPSAMLPGTLFGVYEPPSSMIFGKPDVNEGDIPIVEESIKKATPTTKEPLPERDCDIQLQVTADDELQRLQDASVNSQIRLDDFDPVVVETYVAIADFLAAEESNISLRAGERVQVLDSSRSDWWLVSIPESDRSGWVPADYLEKKILSVDDERRDEDGRITSPWPEPFHDETGEIERVIKRGHRLSQIQLSRHQLYQSPFLATPPETDPDEPSPAQLEGVYSLSVPYVASTEIQAQHTNQLSLVKDQPVRVLDGRRDDWWLAQTIPDYENRTESHENGIETQILPNEGWVPANLLQPSQDDIVPMGGPKSAPPFAAGHGQPLWTVLADYPGDEEGTVRVWQGDLVEVIDISRNEWCLVRLVGRIGMEGEGEEGWVPAGYLKPYSGGGFAYLFPRFPPHMSPDDSDDEESLSADDQESLPLLPLTPEPLLTPYPDPERRADAAEKCNFIVSELISSEKEYVARLLFCVEHYITPAQASTAPKPLQTAQLFDNFREIFEFHRDHFLPELEQCQTHPETLGDVFTSSEERLQIYVAYCKSKAASHTLLQEHRPFFEEIRSQLQDRLLLADYLIMPVSRITKCSLLLSDFRKQSARSAQPAGAVNDALSVTRGIARQANNAIHLDMLEGFSENDVGDLVLLDPFQIQAGSKPGAKQRQVFLFPQCLLITKRERGGSYTIKEKLMLCLISMAPDMDTQKRNLIIYDMNSGTKFILMATKHSVREEWLSCTQKLIQAAKADAANRSTGDGTTTNDNKQRSTSEPPELPPSVTNKVTALKNTLVAKRPSFRLGSAKRPNSASTPSPIPPPSTTVSDEPVVGSEYVVMECIVLEGGDDVQLEPGEIVTLVKVEGVGASLRVRTTDKHLTEGTVPATFLREKTSTNGIDMEAAPKFTMQPTDLDLLYGTTATIVCAFNGFPKPSVEWRVNRQTLTSNNERIKMTSCATSSILEIIMLCYEDIGTYGCYITNNSGSNSAHMTLNIHGPSAKSGKPTISKVTGTSVKLKWTPPEEDGGSPITTYQVEMLQEGFEDWQPIIQQPKTMFIVKALQPNTCYQFRVLACNKYGAGLSSGTSDMITTKGRGWLSSSPSIPRKKEGDFPDGGMFDDLSGGDDGSMSNILSPTGIMSPPPTEFIRRGSIHSEYDVLPEEIGRGRFGIVHKCIHRQTGLQMVAKYVRLRSRKKAEIRREVEILRKISSSRSPYLMEFHNAYERGKNLIIVTELVPGGELIERILLDNDLTEGVVVRYLSHLLSALDCMHSMNIAHLDIKPENILISGVEDNPIIKLIDFGSAQELNGDITLVASSSPEFSAPEIISQEGVWLVADMWSVGVLTYVLLSGTSPFFSENSLMVVDRIKEARYDFYGDQFDQISTEAKEFIACLLQKNPEYRMSADQALEHDWITTLSRVSVQDSAASPWPMARIDTSRLKAFNARRKWHTTAVSTDATAVFGPRSTVFSPIPPDFEELLGRQELPPSLYPDSDVDLNAARGSTVSFQFQVSGYPEPAVVWERGSQRMTTDDRVIISTNEGVTSLTIHDITREDEGLYVCCAMNHLGNTVQECQITLLEPPPPPTEVNGVILGSYNNSALISWLSPSNGPCPITRYLLQLRRTDSSTKTWAQVADDITSTAHVVENLERGVAYVFRVCAMNEIGCGLFSRPSPPLTITDEPDYESDGPEMEDVRRFIQPLELDTYLSSSSSHQ